MMIKKGITGIIFILFTSIAFTTDWSMANVNFYVNSDCGNDNWSGQSILCEAPDVNGGEKMYHLAERMCTT